MKVVSTEALTKLIQLVKSAFISVDDTVETSEVTLATVATTGDYGDLSNKPTIPTVNNATLTIQKNGTNVATFTANASSNVTANISVPNVTSTYTATGTDAVNGVAVSNAIATKQDTLVSGTNIKTINNTSILGSGNIDIQAGADVDLSNLTSQGKNIANWSTNITNCITEIPQDIKLELNNGTLTLKAGSKVYVPNGSGVFDEVMIESDKTASYGHDTLDIVWYRGNGIDLLPLNLVYSGSTAPSGNQYMLWYDTTNNQIKYTKNSGASWSAEQSLPLGVIATSSSAPTSINQVFNGFGYIGSTVFALPGVKGLIPNGRNADGSLKNIEFTNSSVRTYTSTNSFDNWPVIFGPDRFHALANFKVEDTPSRIPTSGQWFSYYSPKDNKIYQSDNGGDWSESLGYIIGNETISSGKITSFTPKTVFHAADYNDVALKQDFQVVSTLPANPDINTFYFIPE